MSDESFSVGKKVYRRRRRHQGASFSSLYEGAELKEDGPWCRRCKRRHGYMVCKIRYADDFSGKDPVLLWLCPNFMHVIGELVLSATKEHDAAGSSEEADGTEAEEGGDPAS